MKYHALRLPAPSMNSCQPLSEEDTYLLISAPPPLVALNHTIAVNGYAFNAALCDTVTLCEPLNLSPEPAPATIGAAETVHAAPLVRIPCLFEEPSSIARVPLPSSRRQ